jgi:hypothetical protein
MINISALKYIITTLKIVIKREKGEQGCMNSLLPFPGNQITKPQIQAITLILIGIKCPTFVLFANHGRNRFLYSF